ncbi:hypothetical protein KVR01_008864 [Diaporthe batatas]|uniref:uncharacterized protein n=1 Tax=Diaporthe batatas TaxID=748121 RepID=UPI001D05A6DC|nr:uncharacterized protein KVR01_008864 [Diaporthe batatas]KAG8161877.1 hypothetical protein KVR01_008864 [Diaporthe batatas]
MLSPSLVRPAKHVVRRVGSNLLGGVRQQPLWRRDLMTIHKRTEIRAPRIGRRAPSLLFSQSEHRTSKSSRLQQISVLRDFRGHKQGGLVLWELGSCLPALLTTLRYASRSGARPLRPSRPFRGRRSLYRVLLSQQMGARLPIEGARISVLIHNTKGNLVTIDNLGATVSQEVIISRGGEDESFVMAEREVGLAMKSSIVRQLGVSLTSDPEAIPLKFHHKSLHFAHESLPYPRLIIDKELAGPDSSGVSAATLWLYGPAACEFTLDGTPDHDFAKSSRESHQRLKGVLEELKDR